MESWNFLEPEYQTALRAFQSYLDTGVTRLSEFSQIGTAEVEEHMREEICEFSVDTIT